MHLIRSTIAATLCAFGVATLAPTSAAGDGLPVPVETANTGIGSADGARHFHTVANRPGRSATDQTTLIELDTATEEIRRTLRLDGHYVVPAVAIDSTTGGLSHDGKTLVLIEPRASFPRRSTPMVVVDTERMKVLDRFTLPGDFSFDAISTDGSMIYLINYTDRRDPNVYEVRAYDTVPGKLRREPVLNTSEVELTMRGLPLNRVTSADGRWEYTLYDGGGGTPFVHALDVEGASAVCVAIEVARRGGNRFPTSLELASDGTLTVRSRKQTALAEIDTGSFTVSSPSKADSAGSNGGSGPGVGVVAIVAVVLAGLFGVGLRRHGWRRRGAAASGPTPQE